MPGANQPSTKHWCLVCKWNTTHPTQDCMHIARWAKERDASRAQGNYHGNFQHGYVRQEMAKPVLGAQPPPPGTMPVRYVEADHQEPSLELVSTPPYYQESSFENYEPHEEFVDANKHPYYVTYPQETNSMMLVGPMQSRMPPQLPPYGQQPYPQRRAIQASPGVKCFKCQGDHLMRDCPELVPQQQKFPPVERHCVKCCSKHFPKDCPSKPREVVNPNQGPKTSLNYLETIPSSNTSKTETERVPLNVVTRAQHRRNAEAQIDLNPEAPKETKTRMKRQTRSRGSKKSKEETSSSNKSQKHLKHEQEKPQEQTPVQDDRESSKPSSGGSVIVDRVNEPLKAALDAYNSRITPQTEIPKKLQEYPNPKEEKEQLATHQ